jgi:phosphate-selective porin OprO and OprP
MRTPVLVTVVLCVTPIFTFGSHACAQTEKTIDELLQKIDRLEARIRQLEENRDDVREMPVLSVAGSDSVEALDQKIRVIERRWETQSEAVEESKKAAPFTAGWKDGFLLQTPDKSFLLRITGQIQADYRDYLDNDDTTDIDSFFVRRARLGIESTVFNYYEFRLLPDFGLGQARVQDAYLNVHYCDWLQVEMGKFKQPFSYEQLIQDRFVPTIERSIIDQLVPARDVGFMLHGQKLFDDRLDWAIAVSNGEINGDNDTNSHKDVAGRIVLRPFNDPSASCWLRGLQIGISGTMGNEQEPISPARLRSPAFVPWFQFNKTVVADGDRDRWSPEVAYFCGPFGFAAQYLHETQEMRPNSVAPGSKILVDVPSEGYYFMATYLITGEHRTSYSEAIEPAVPFDPHCPFAAPGAWEFVGRFSRLRLGDEVFAPGVARLADPTSFSSGASELTLGSNWYLNRWVRTQFNWEHVWFDDPVQLGTGGRGLLNGQDTLMARFQVIF